LDCAIEDGEFAMKTIGDAEAHLTQRLLPALASLLPETAGLPIRIELCQKGRKKRADASFSSWRPEAQGEIRVHFGGTRGAAVPGHAGEGQAAPQATSSPVPHVVGRQPDGLGARRLELITLLDRAERRPGLQFVSLKWFRDQFIPAEGHGWAEAPEERDAALRSAIEDGVVLTYRVLNPKDPRFPTTAVRLNRSHPDVRAALGGSPAASAFQPVKIQGKGLSETVLQERR
jgi:hypothetical protein